MKIVTFCTQSVKYKADIQRYQFKSIKQIVSEAKIAKDSGAQGYCLVTAGKGLNDKKVEFISMVTKAIKKEIKNLKIIACNGTATLGRVKIS